jgi:sirohydrochlorin ferrochelatase
VGAQQLRRGDAGRRGRVRARPLRVDVRLLEAARERIAAAEAAAPRAVPRDETALLVVGRGTNDPDANSNVAKVMRMLWEGLGFGWGAVRLFGRRASARRRGAVADGAARLPARGRVPLFFFHRRVSEADLRAGRRGRGARARTWRSSRPTISTTTSRSRTRWSSASARC